MRKFVAAAALAVGMVLPGAASVAQTYPSKPIKLVVPFGPGSATDTLGRIAAQELSQAIGQPVVIVNKAGADGAIGATEVQRSAPDGYTFLFGSNSPLVVVPNLRKEPPYDTLKDFTPVTFLGDNTFFIVVHPSVPAKSLAELIAHGKANPKKLNYASGNTFSIVGTALFAQSVGIEMEHIPYKSEPDAIIDLLSGTVQLMNASVTTVLPHVKDGKLRALVTTLPQRSPLLPDVPSIVEAGQPKFPIGPWGGMVGPAGLPADIVQRMNKEMVAVLGKPEIKEAMLKHGFVAKTSTPEEFGTYLKDQLAVWKKALDDAGIKPN